MNKNKIGVLASCALLALTLGACGKSSSTSSTGSTELNVCDHLRRRLDVRRPGLPAVGLGHLGPDRQLPARRLGRGDHRPGGQDRRLRRQRSAAEARRIHDA